MTTTTERIESVIDEVIANAYDEIWKTQDTIARTVSSLHYINRTQRIPKGRSWDWAISEAAVIEAVKAKIESGVMGTYNGDSAARAIDSITSGYAEIAEIKTYIRELNEVYEAAPWSRFFLVIGGHIHSSTNCHSCYYTTRFSWLPALSGMTEADAVAEHGTILCSHCYPTAPVEWTVGKQGEKPADYYCTGSGKVPATEPYRAVRRDGTEYTGYRYLCAGCGNRISERQITVRGLVKKHKAA